MPRSGRAALALCSPEKGHTQMKWTSIAAAALCALPMSGCTSYLARPDIPLATDEGMVVMSMNCQSNINYVTLFPSGADSGGAFAERRSDFDVGCKAGLVSLRMKAGRHYIGHLIEHGYGFMGLVKEGEALVFDVQPGVITYVGEIIVFGLYSHAGNSDRWVSVRNREAESRRLLEEKQGWLLARYPFRRQLAVPAQGAPSSDALEEELRACGEKCNAYLAPPLQMR